MAEKVLDRRLLLRGAGVSGAAMVGGLAVTGSAQADEGHNGVEGSWLITHQDDPGGDPAKGRGVASFAAGGVLTEVEIAPVGPPGAGSWVRTGQGKFKGVFWSGSSGQAPGEPDVTVRVRPRGRVVGDRISGTYSFTVFDAKTGKQLASGTGKFRGDRIEA